MAERHGSGGSSDSMEGGDGSVGSESEPRILDDDTVSEADRASASRSLELPVNSLEYVIVVGYDAWTEPVLVQLAEHGVSFTVVTTDDGTADRLEERGLSVVLTDDVDEACFRAAELNRADAVLVATLDDQLNVLAVLTVMNVDESMRVVTFAGEGQDVPKLRAAGADSVVSIGQAVGELLVEVALSERDVSDVVGELVGSGS
ncbi:NAD-binding protein [Salinarchaeum laminariae]|uniref:NAD-binding protein n=1 Tax=Salinarchaeum laminariae TaxID=869888 RepID=UPI0020C10829|nr:NAD(P)-binding protein [Salinarchaeum laminariae]